MVVIYTGVDHCHLHALVSGSQSPSLGGVDVGILLSACLPGVVQSPELGKFEIVRDDLRSALARDMKPVVWLNVRDRGISLKLFHRGLEICPFIELDERQPIKNGDREIALAARLELWPKIVL